MRNLKRALSLALASVMLVGMMVVGTSAASFPDVSDEQNVEAIEVLNAVEVMVGDNGDFRPDDNVTRYEMAVIIAKLMLGPDDAAAYKGVHPFTDLTEGDKSWVEPYLAYCYNEGIIAGRTETEYDGQANVTAEEAAAMMMRALGYKKLERPEYGSNWAENVVDWARRINLFDDVTSNPKALLTRNQIAQLSLNTLESTMVTTTTKREDMQIGDTFIRGEYEYNAVTSDNTVDYNQSTDGAQQLCEKLFGKKLNKNPGDEDAMGREVTTWVYDGKDVVSTANEADYTVVLKETPDTMDDLLDLAKKGLETNLAATGILKNGDAISALTDLGAGDIVEFTMDPDNSKKVASIFVTRYVLDQITAIDADVSDDDAEDGVACYVDFEGNGGTKVPNTDIPGFNADTYVEDAYVALLISETGDDNNGTIVDSYIPETVEDSVETVKGTTEVTIGSTKYTAAASIGDGVGDTDVDTVTPGADNTYTLYLDNNGYILGIVEVEGEAAGIDDVYYLDSVWSVSGKSDTYYAQLVALDGTVSEVQLEKVDHNLPNNKNDLSASDYDYTALNGLLVTISDKKVGSTSKANNDKYNVKVWAPDADWDADQIKSNLGDLKKDGRNVTAKIEDGGSGADTTYRLNASTVYLFVEKSGDDLAVSRYVGGVAFTGSGAIDGKSYIITEKDKTVAKYIVIATNNAEQDPEYSSDVIFIKSASTTKGSGFYSQTVYLPDGKEETWKIAEDEYTGGALEDAVPAFFTYSENDDGYYTLNGPIEIDTANTSGGAVTKDWQDKKPEGVLSPVVIDDKDDLFEDLLTVTSGEGNEAVTFQDITVAGAAFKDLHDKDDEEQYDRVVTSLSALIKLFEGETPKAASATLSLNVSKDGAVTIFVTEIAKAEEEVDPGKTQVTEVAFDDYTMATNGQKITDPTCTTSTVNVSYAWADKADSNATVTAGSTDAASGKTYVLTATVTVKDSETHELGTLTAPTLGGVQGKVSDNKITFEFTVN